jgi:hypothetical protein
MNIEQHLTNEALIAALYQTEPAPAHLATCAHCQLRLQTMQARQHADASRETLSARTLSAQRANIYSRMDGAETSQMFGSRWLWAGAPLAAAAALLVMVNVGSFQTKPAPEAQVAQVETTQSETLYTDIYQSLSLGAPAGVQTVAGMFDVAERDTAARKN